MKKFTLILCVAMLMVFCFAAPAAADEVTPSAELNYYTVLVLDASGTHNFSSGSTRIYSADPATAEVKSAAKEFSDVLLRMDGNHYIAVVSYAEYAYSRCDFTNDAARVTNAINGISTGKEYVSVDRGLKVAHQLLSDIDDLYAVKNVVIFTTGMNNTGDHNTYTKYDENTPASNWYMDSNGNHKQGSNEYCLYEYANGALASAQVLHKYANVYSIGLFDTWDGMPAAGQELVTFFKMFTEDLANPLTNFVPVYDKSGIDSAFEQVCNGIIGNPFKDVTYSGYYFDAVLWAMENGITSGTGLYSFDPNEICTREQMVTFLWRAEGKIPPTTTTTPFKDLNNNAWSRDAILWATETGTTVGTGPDTFEPDRIVTREQVVTFLWRIAGCPEATSVPAFTDVSPANWSYDAILWAAEQGITVGTTPTTFSPADPCTRGQIVTFLYRYYYDGETE